MPYSGQLRTWPNCRQYGSGLMIICARGPLRNSTPGPIVSGSTASREWTRFRKPKKPPKKRTYFYPHSLCRMTSWAAGEYDIIIRERLRIPHQPNMHQRHMMPISLILVLFTAQVTAHGQEQARPRPILLTTDIGADMDDQWVLAQLVLGAEFDVRGVVTTHTGSYPALPAPAAESSARVAEEVLDHLPLSKRPKVIAGSSDPLRSKTEPRRGQGVDFIVRESRGYDRTRPLTIVVIGAATDVASALLVDPSLAERVEIVAMAFGKWPDGGDEFNVKNDVKAWQVLLESSAPIVVSDGAVALRVPHDAGKRPQPVRRPGQTGPTIWRACSLTGWIGGRIWFRW